MPTIVPITFEHDWDPYLGDIPIGDVPLVPTLVLAPHPDDEALGAGGLIYRLRAAGAPVTVVAVTNGENAYSDSKGLADVRVAEQTEALRRLGVPENMICRLHLPDGSVSEHEERLVEQLGCLLSSEMHLIAPWAQDFHPDHEATGRAAMRAVQSTGASLTSYLFWTWHRGTPGLLRNLPLSKVPLSDEEVAAKVNAIEAHRSQLQHPDGQPILSADLLAPARRKFEVYIR